MKISGFTIARNAVKFHYPLLESLRVLRLLCDEVIVNVGDSEDDTLGLVRSLADPRIRIIQNIWDMSQGKEVLSHQTNLALRECTGDWAVYLQSDELFHEADIPRLRHLMQRYLTDPSVDALRFRWLHFYGSYYRYRIDHGWFQKQDRIIRNNGTIESEGDAWGFRRRDGRPLRRRHSGCFLYHYGWVQPEEVMTQRRVNAEQIGFVTLDSAERQGAYDYGDLNRFPPYFGSHPAVMAERVRQHALSQTDRKDIRRRFWWHPLRIFSARYKTSRRVKVPIK